MAEVIKVLRGKHALEVIEELLDNNYVLTPDFRLVHLPLGWVIIKKSAASGPTQTSGVIDWLFDPITKSEDLGIVKKAQNRLDWPGKPFNHTSPPGEQ